MNVVLLHYRYAPSVAGVERVLEAHARLLAEAGHGVTILCGAGSSADPRIRVVRLPWLLEPGEERFAEREAEALAALRPWAEAADRVVIHNVLTMPFHLPCTAALWRLAQEGAPGRWVSWVHDLAAANPDDPRATGSPEPAWARLRQRPPGVRVVAVSEQRAAQFHEVTGTLVDAIVPNGVDPAEVLGLPERLAHFAEMALLWEADALLLQPARLLQRKRIDFGLEVLAALRAQTGLDARLLITGAPDEHRPASAQYAMDARELRQRLGLDKAAWFLWEHFAVTNAELAGLYSLGDLLWFPSRDEGFGLPIVEAALHRLPVFATDTPPMNTFPLSQAAFFDPAAPAATVARELAAFLHTLRPGLGARREVWRRYAWSAVAAHLFRALSLPASSP